MFAARVQAMFIALTLAWVGSATAQTAPTATSPQGTRALLVLVSDGALDPATLTSIVGLAERRLNQDGLQTFDYPGIASPHPLDESLTALVRGQGVERLFALHVLRLGAKIIFQMDELDLDAQRVIATGSMSGAVEDADMILPRLVDAVVHRQSVESTATVSTVTPEEARPYNQRPGTSHFVLGLPFGLSNGATSGAFGISLGYLYETEHWGLGVQGMDAVATNGNAFALNIYGNYFFRPGFWSPYVGLGLGFMTIEETLSDGSSRSGNGAGVIPEVGIELFRLNHIRLRVAVQALLPFYENEDGSYLPAALFHVSVAF